MVDALTDKEGRIVAYIEWSIEVKNRGGINATVLYLWVHQSYRNNGCIKSLKTMMRKKCPEAIDIKWDRLKYNERLSKYSIKRIMKEKQDG